MQFLDRFYGYKKLVYVLLAYPASGVLVFLFGGQPDDFQHWPEQAQAAVVLLASGGWGLVIAAWFALLLRPLLSFEKVGRWLYYGILGFSAIFKGLPNVWDVMRGMGLAIQGGPTAMWHIGWAVFWVTLLPTVISSLVALWPDIWDRLQTWAPFRRIAVAGQGHSSGFAAGSRIHRNMAPLPEKPKSQAGHLSSHPILGRSLFESTYVGGQNVFLKENSHLVTIATTGGGKLISSIAPNACLHRGSAVMISPKPELADMFVGRRVDSDLFENSVTRFPNLGIDPRGITSARFHIPGSRSFVLDPSQQSVYQSSTHNIISEVNVNDDFARSLIYAIATGIVPDNPDARDPFWINSARSFVAAGIGHALTRFQDPAEHTLPSIVEMLMGFDRQTRTADPMVFKKTLIQMMKNNALGGFIQSAASNIAQLGDRAFGAVNTEVGNYTRWILDPMMRRHLTGQSEFSYRDLGDERFPITVFIVPPRAAFQEALPYLRVHAELALQQLVLSPRRPAIPTWFLCDEFRQYGQRIRAIRDGATILREASVRLHLQVQSYPSLIDIVGEQGANELRSCSAMQYFGVNDMETAEQISRELGQYTVKHRGRLPDRQINETNYDVVTPAEVRNELTKSSPLQYVFPAASGTAMRLERVAHKPIRTAEGGRFNGLPLDGHYDDDLNRFGRKSAA